jgi:hypothetical protein
VVRAFGGGHSLVGGKGYTAATPSRVMDTRFGLGAAKANVGPGGRSP